MYLDSNQITQVLPQAYPFVMIDRVVEFKKGESLTAVKNITANEWMFADPGWGSNVFPETLLLEAAAQATILLYHLSKVKEGEKHPKYIFGKTKADFLNRVYIGDQLKIVTCATKMFDKLGFMDTKLSVNTADVADIQIMYSVVR